jgi:hypothetical protein
MNRPSGGHNATLRYVHGVIRSIARALSFLEDAKIEERPMKRLFMFLIPLSLLAMTGCVVAPYPRAYYRAAIIAPTPVVVVRP